MTLREAFQKGYEAEPKKKKNHVKKIKRKLAPLAEKAGRLAKKLRPAGRAAARIGKGVARGAKAGYYGGRFALEKGGKVARTVRHGTQEIVRGMEQTGRPIEPFGLGPPPGRRVTRGRGGMTVPSFGISTMGIEPMGPGIRRRKKGRRAPDPIFGGNSF